MAENLGDKGFKDQLKGVGKEAEGRLRNAAGGLAGDSKEQLKGKAQEIRGKAQREIGELESDADRKSDDV